MSKNNNEQINAVEYLNSLMGDLAKDKRFQARLENMDGDIFDKTMEIFKSLYGRMFTEEQTAGYRLMETLFSIAGIELNKEIKQISQINNGIPFDTVVEIVNKFAKKIESSSDQARADICAVFPKFANIFDIKSDIKSDIILDVKQYEDNDDIIEITI